VSTFVDINPMDRYLEKAVIAPSARKHGIQDKEMHHALRHHWDVTSSQDPEVLMYVGPSTTGELLEIGVVIDPDYPMVIHAMTARPKYLRGKWN